MWKRDMRYPKSWFAFNECGLCVTGLPERVTASEVLELFASCGSIQTIDVRPYATCVAYSNRDSVDKAMHHIHSLRGNTLKLSRICDLDGWHDGYVNKSELVGGRVVPTYTSDYEKDLIQVQPAVEHHVLLEILRKCKSIEDQIHSLKSLILAGEAYCKDVKQLISVDIWRSLEVRFVIKELHAFGSMVTGLAFRGSDVDVYVNMTPRDFGGKESPQFNMSPRDKVGRASKCFYAQKSLFNSVMPVRNAKIPIVKIVHTFTNVACDVSFGDHLGYCNSKLLRLYLNMNSRFFDMIVIIKYWAKIRQYVNSSKFSNYSIIILAISFLQSLKDSNGKRLVPTVEDLQKNVDHSVESNKVGCWVCGFDETPVKIMLPDSPEFTIVGLLKGFFSYVSSFPFETHVVSILTGDMISRQLFEEKLEELPDVFRSYKIHIAEKPQEKLSKPLHSMVIHDPFKLSHNLTDRVALPLKNEFISACMYLAKHPETKAGSYDLFYFLRPVPSKPRSRSRGKKQSDRISKFLSKMKHPEWECPPNYSYIKEFNLLQAILQNIMLLDVRETEDNLPPKKIKLTESDDVHSSTALSTISRTLVCSGDKGLWDGRGKARKRLSISSNPNYREELLISAEINKKPLVNCNLHFACHFYADASSREIKIEFADLTDSTVKSSFVSFVHFMAFYLQKWMKSFLNQFE